MNQPKFLDYNEWLKQNPEYNDEELDEYDECKECDGSGAIDCECEKCCDVHDVECEKCNGMGETHTSIRIYKEMKAADQKKWARYNGQFKEVPCKH